MNNITEAVQERIEELLQSREEELKKISQEQERLEQEEAELQKALEASVEALDEAKHAKISDKLRKTREAIMMYAERYKQLNAGSLINSAEYTAVMTHLSDYVAEQRRVFEHEALELLISLQMVCTTYTRRYTKAEALMQRWNTEIAKKERLARLNNGGELCMEVRNVLSSEILDVSMRQYLRAKQTAQGE